MSFFSKMAKGTRSRFSKNRTEAPARPIPQPESAPVISRQVETKAKETETEQVEADVTNDKLEPKPTPVRNQLVKPNPKAADGQEITEPHTTTSAQMNTTDDIYHIFWRPENGYNMIPTRVPRTNYYAPNAIALFRILDESEKRINTSKHIQTHEPNYNPYAVKVYYAFMFHFQGMWARKDAGAADGNEVSLLKRFEAKHPKTSLPCAEIVYPIFNTIVSTELADAKYDWIVPRIAPGILRDAHANITSTDGSIFLQPMVPQMMAILNTFIHSDTDNLPAMMDDNNNFVPINLNPAAHAQVNVFGTNIADNDATNNEFKTIFAANGVSSPFNFGNENYPSAARHARRSDFGYDINVTVINGQAAANDGRNLDNTYDFSTIERFLFMTKGSNQRFFSYLKEQAIIHARFFDSVYHFSDVQTTGGLETTIVARLRIETNVAANLFLDSTLLGVSNPGGGITSRVTWYPRVMRNLTAGFATSRAGVRRNEELQALAFATNATLPIRTAVNNPPIGSTLRTGDYWANQQWIRDLFYEDTTAGKPMFTDHSTAVLRCYRETPHGTGVVDNEF